MINTMNTLKSTALGLVAVLSGILLSGCIPGVDSNTSSNIEKIDRVVIVLDQTEQFKENLPAAAKTVGRFIREQKLTGDMDIYLIALDGDPHVLGIFQAAELAKKEESDVLKIIDRISTTPGKDVVSALQLAVEKLNEDPIKKDTEIGTKRLLVFSDLVVTPGAKSFRPLQRFDWMTLSSCQAVRLYYVDENSERDTKGTVLNLLGQSCLPSERCTVLGPVASRQIKTSEIAE